MMSIVYRTYLHTIMENNKVVFLCLILLLVLVVSNYVKVQEGFKAKKKTPDAFKSPRQIAREEADKVKKVAKDALSEAKKAMAEAKKITSSQPSQTSQQAQTSAQNLVKNTETLVKDTTQKMETLVKNATTQMDASKTQIDASKTDMEQKIKTSNELNNKVLGKVSGLDANVTKISNSASTIDTKLENATKINNSFEKNASSYITNISGKAAAVDESVKTNKQIQKEINEKVDGVDKQVDKIKTYTDTVIQIKNDVDKIMNEFKLSSETMLKTMQLAVDKMNANQIPAKTQGFQNMNDPVLQASESLKKDMEMAKSLAFTTIDSAYNGDLHLETPWNSAEGFVDSTTTKSAYVDPADIFNLEKEVLTAFNNFNTKYYDIYQTCLQSKRKIKDRIKNGEKGLTEPNCGNLKTGKLKEVYDAKTELIGKITTLNAAIVAMGKKSESIAVDSNGNYLISNRKVTEEEFKKRHQQIKDLHNNISSMRSDLDMKMANLLDKTKGPLPEAQNKYNYENYATIGWSILATSILYYTFVEMK